MYMYYHVIGPHLTIHTEQNTGTVIPFARPFLCYLRAMEAFKDFRLGPDFLQSIGVCLF